MTVRNDVLKIFVCAALVVVLAGYTAMAVQLDIGERDAPGPGLMPCIVGVAGLVVALLATLSAVRDLRNRPAETSTAHDRAMPVDEDEGGDADSILTGAELRRLGAAVAAVAALAVLTPILGFAVAALLSGTALSVVAGQRVWWKALATGAATAVGVSLLFVTILEVPLPAGVLG